MVFKSCNLHIHKLTIHFRTYQNKSYFFQKRRTTLILMDIYYNCHLSVQSKRGAQKVKWIALFAFISFILLWKMVCKKYEAGSKVFFRPGLLLLHVITRRTLSIRRIAHYCSRTVTFITTSVFGRSPIEVSAFCIASTTSKPSSTSPNTV